MLIRISKEMYYSNKVLETRGNSKALWRTLRETTGLRRKKDSFPIEHFLKEPGYNCNNITDVADSFNKYYKNVGATLADALPPAAETVVDDRDYRAAQTFQLVPGTEDELVKCILGLKGGSGVVIVFWLLQETNNLNDDIFKNILNEAQKNQLEVAFCIEAFSSSKANELVKDIQLVTKYYSTHPAFYKLMKNGRSLPVYYLFNSHLAPAFEWRKLLASDGSQSVRGTQYDGHFIGLLIDVHHKLEITRSHFDGFYTYFSSNGCYYGSSWKNWKALEKFAEKNHLLFFPTVSPGYIDTKVRPWNTALTRHRSHGHYYQVAWRSAISAKPFGVSITSYNNWEEGSQIEPAKPTVTPQFTYLDYQPEGPFFYLNLTRYWVKQLTLQTK